MPLPTRDELPFPLGLVGVALQGIIGHIAICIAMIILKSASGHAICQDCHLNERWQPDGKEDEDKNALSPCFLRLYINQPKKVPPISSHREIHAQR